MPDVWMLCSVGAGFANVGLALGLIVLYGATYSKTRAPFTLALILFAAAFLAQNALVVYAYVTMMEVVPPAMNPYLFAIGAFEAAGLGAMLWTATR